MPQYLIPQKTQREDKILGPLTGKQLIYAILTLGGSYLLFAMMNTNPIVEFAAIERLLITLPFFLFGLALTFVEVNGRSFEIWMANFIAFVTTPKIRVWEKEVMPPAVIKIANQKEKASKPVKTDKKQPAPLSHSEIDRLSQMLDKPDEAQTIIPAGPTSKTLELLKAVEEQTDTEQKQMQVLAKQSQGTQKILHTIASFPAKILFGKEKKKKQPQAAPKTNIVLPEQDQTEKSPTKQESAPPASNPKGDINNEQEPKPTDPESIAKSSADQDKINDLIKQAMKKQ